MTIGKSMDNGFAGNYAQQPDFVVRTLPVSEDSEPILFGDPIVLDDGFAKNVDASLTADTFVGVATSAIVSQVSLNDTAGQYLPGDASAIMTRGIINVTVQGDGEPKLGAPVYVRVANGTGDLRIGGFEAANSSDVIKLNKVVWMSSKDSSGTASIQMTQINVI